MLLSKADSQSLSMTPSALGGVALVSVCFKASSSSSGGCSCLVVDLGSMGIKSAATGFMLEASDFTFETLGWAFEALGRW